MSGRRSSSVSKSLASQSLRDTAEKAKSDKRKIDETPPPSEWKKAFGNKCKVSEDGRSFELKLRDDADIKRAIEMQDGARREEIDRGAEMQARMPRERVIRKDGRVIDFPEELVDQAKHKFKGGAGRNGRSVPLHFSMNVIGTPKWSRMCSVCGTGQGMWRQWSKPEIESEFECDICGGKDDWFWDRDEEA